jgi:4-hydroxy-tetrahydrodipicolinate synthase
MVLVLPGCASLPNRGLATNKPLRGIFPIAQTPFTDDNKLDVDSLAREVKFIHAARVHGIVWPQLASEWMTLSEAERMSGMEAMGAASKGLRPALVFGVQGADLNAVRRYIRKAEECNADAIISLPPLDVTDRGGIMEYYKQVGSSTPLPLFVQAVGDMDVEMLMEMHKAIPTMRFVKDEAADPLNHGAALHQQSKGTIKVFSGAHGRRLMEELPLGFSGSMPAASLADLYAQTFELWQADKKAEARAMHDRTLAALTPMLKYGLEGMKYVLIQRGVFKTYRARPRVPSGFGGAAAVATGGSNNPPLDEEGKKAIDQMLESVKPYLRV